MSGVSEIDRYGQQHTEGERRVRRQREERGNNERCRWGDKIAGEREMR